MKAAICISLILILFGSPILAQDTSDAPRGLVPNAQGEYEVPAEVYIDMDSGADVFLDGVKIGSCPLTLKLNKALSNLSISGPKGNAKAILRVNSELTSPSTLRLPWQPPLSNLTVTTVPAGAEVLINGQSKGLSPLNLDLATGNYTISARRDRHIYTQQNIELGFSIPYNVEIKGYARHRVSLNLNLENQSHFSITGLDFKAEYNYGDEILLTDGIYNLNIYDSILVASTPLVFQVKGSDIEVSLDTLRQSGTIQISGINPKSRIYINETQFLPNLNGQVEYATGFVKLEIVEPGYLPFISEQLAILPNSTTTISYPRMAGIDSNRDTTSTLGWICSGLGLVVTSYSAIATYTDLFSPNIQLDLKTGETTTIIGAAVLGTGIINLIISAILDDDYQKQEAKFATYQQIAPIAEPELTTP